MISGGSSAKLPPSSAGTGATARTTGATASTSSTGASGATAQEPRLVISISSKGEIFLGATLVRDDALPAKLRELASRGKDTPLVVRANRNVSAGRVVSVMDQAKQAGLSRVSLAIEP